CVVCFEDLDNDEFPETTLAEGCSHEVDVCHGCVAGNVNSQIQASAEAITCPSCLTALSYDIVKANRYDRQQLLATLKDDPNFATCLGPDCLSGQIHELGASEPILTCQVCNFKACFVHKMPWHSNQTCTEYDESRKLQAAQHDQRTEEFLSKTTKACPNPACGWRIQKNGGCDHLVCKMCQHEFCWACLAPYRAIRQHGNTAHRDDC
ncbi:hypothetical protein BJ875DRAFT_350598, partial [Amylocarpus encephaloides]